MTGDRCFGVLGKCVSEAYQRYRCFGSLEGALAKLTEGIAFGNVGSAIAQALRRNRITVGRNFV
ncbi:MAG: hypothetical protein F6K62_05480 [Sphaerospermopsis sp. SIO1G2]|nr:hypothetical protein [Sphaerospermopsis sp. SIO1G1]NET70451.1 hypothetical protein [Sphaerospermopsis sp. SIO1G2]